MRVNDIYFQLATHYHGFRIGIKWWVWAEINFYYLWEPNDSATKWNKRKSIAIPFKSFSFWERRFHGEKWIYKN